MLLKQSQAKIIKKKDFLVHAMKISTTVCLLERAGSIFLLNENGKNVKLILQICKREEGIKKKMIFWICEIFLFSLIPIYGIFCYCRKKIEHKRKGS
jgi:hypothetical protein